MDGWGNLRATHDCTGEVNTHTGEGKIGEGTRDEYSDGYVWIWEADRFGQSLELIDR